ncbi:hypothetical protein N0V90_003332 [Kalmusia sp. IMI 367209]|nr:hypothetical protein N0V90_003332 [Kalmusia sp. IMI 367209]
MAIFEDAPTPDYRAIVNSSLVELLFAIYLDPETADAVEHIDFTPHSDANPISFLADEQLRYDPSVQHHRPRYNDAIDHEVLDGLRANGFENLLIDLLQLYLSFDNIPKPELFMLHIKAIQPCKNVALLTVPREWYCNMESELPQELLKRFPKLHCKIIHVSEDRSRLIIGDLAGVVKAKDARSSSAEKEDDLNGTTQGRSPLKRDYKNIIDTDDNTSASLKSLTIDTRSKSISVRVKDGTDNRPKSKQKAPKMVPLEKLRHRSSAIHNILTRRICHEAELGFIHCCAYHASSCSFAKRTPPTGVNASKAAVSRDSGRRQFRGVKSGQLGKAQADSAAEEDEDIETGLFRRRCERGVTKLNILQASKRTRSQYQSETPARFDPGRLRLIKNYNDLQNSEEDDLASEDSGNEKI